MRFYLFFCLTCLSSFSLFSQRYSFMQYSNSLGLPQSQIQCMDQDDKGYLWVGTLGGVAKFNGKRFISLKNDKQLFDNRIFSILCEKEDVWLGHEGGVSCISPKKVMTWKLPVLKTGVRVNVLLRFKDMLLAGTEGEGVFVYKKGKWKKISLPNNDANLVRSLAVVGNNLFIGTYSGLYFCSENFTFYHYSPLKNYSISSMTEKEGRLWIGTVFYGVYILEKNKLRPISNETKEPYISGICLDKNDQVWSYSVDGVWLHNRLNKTISFTEKLGIPASFVNYVFEDKDGDIWLGTDGKGLYRFCGFETVNYTKKTGLISELVLSSALLPSGNRLLGTYDKGLIEMDDFGKSKVISEITGSVWAIHRINDIYFLACTEGLFMYQNGAVQRLKNSPQEKFSTLNRFSNGKLYCGGEGGVYEIVNQSLIPLKQFNSKSLNIGEVTSLVYFNGKIICASSNGVYEWNDETRTCKLLKYFKTGASCLEVDNLNVLWIGTENGLFLYDGFQFSEQFLAKGSSAKFINFIFRSKENIWVGTNNGAYVYDSWKQTTRLVDHFGLEDGLLNLETNINSCFQDDNYLWFGTAEGLVQIANQDVYFRKNAKTQRIQLNEVLLNNQQIAITKYATGFNSVGLPTGLDLPYKYNSITLLLDAIVLSDPEEAQLQYFLEGYNDGFSEPVSTQNITYNNLPFGEYVLHVRALGKAGEYSDEFTFPIKISAPFYRKWYFILGMIALAFLVVRFFVRSRIKQMEYKLNEENLQNKNRLIALEQQSLNASMNRHFIFNSLNSIQYFINTQDRVSANRFLTNFAKLIRKNLDSAAEDNNMVSLAQELERLELYLSLESMRFKGRFEYIIDAAEVDTESVLVPAMLLQPFVENSIIHGILPKEDELGKIAVILKVISGQLEISIDDNGIGFDKSLSLKSKFAGDHKSQGMEITTKRINLIRMVMKKEYELIGPFEMHNDDGSINGTRVLIKIPYENV